MYVRTVLRRIRRIKYLIFSSVISVAMLWHLQTKGLWWRLYNRS